MENAHHVVEHESPKESRFDGLTVEGAIIKFFASLLTSLSLGLLYPVAVVWKENWETKHTVIDGKRLRFTGTVAGMYGLWFKIWFLGIITLTIYFWFAASKVRKWKVNHTHFD
ncbi:MULTISPECIES: DUF898 domain-containing protein [Pontibacillus]|uniref:DUF898 family protein n=1 Tax=Pontibacillus chungwhensis TaxID=265426 RepID=A0ABY8UYL9_9BACI|nr:MULTISPECIES: DUF898 domain-containing protein [Pontibacillus]MCD5324801.1 DUF898 domain-containing protein [Pontibacillus sp. HN14]WIF98760.1 hypothetical protein QNI29_03660 [Pontibacillus chungwhensis]